MSHPPLPTVYLYTFGFRHGGAPADESGHGGGFVFDCRALPNPFWDEKLRPFAGTDPEIVAFMEAQPEVQAFAERATALVLQMARAYRERGLERLMVAFGCTGGRHRSVYQGERLAAILKAEGFPVVLVHRDVDGPHPSEPL